MLKYLTEQSGDTSVYNRLGIALRKQGKWEKAIKEFTRAIKIDPKDEVLYFNIAKAYLDGGMKPEAAQSLKNALGINPDFEEAKEELRKLEHD